MSLGHQQLQDIIEKIRHDLASSDEIDELYNEILFLRSSVEAYKEQIAILLEPLKSDK